MRMSFTAQEANCYMNCVYFTQHFFDENLPFIRNCRTLTQHLAPREKTVINYGSQLLLGSKELIYLGQWKGITWLWIRALYRNWEWEAHVIERFWNKFE